MHRVSMEDTPPAVHAVLVEGYRAMPAGKKLRCVSQLTMALEELALADVRRRHPEADAREQALRVASRRIEPSLMAKAFGWSAEASGF